MWRLSVSHPAPPVRSWGWSGGWEGMFSRRCLKQDGMTCRITEPLRLEVTSGGGLVQPQGCAQWFLVSPGMEVPQPLYHFVWEWLIMRAAQYTHKRIVLPRIQAILINIFLNKIPTLNLPQMPYFSFLTNYSWLCNGK